MKVTESMKTVEEIRAAISNPGESIGAPKEYKHPSDFNGNRNREIEDEYIRRAYELGFAEGSQFGADEMIEANAQRYENPTYRRMQEGRN